MPNLPPEAFQTPVASSPTPAVKTDGAAVPPQPRRTTAAVVDWKGEYGEVLNDLARTFIIFTALVVGMIVLSFVIR